MILVRVSTIAALAAVLIGAAPCAATPPVPGGTIYVLETPPSSLVIGCQGPCACPLFSRPTYGSFTLLKTGFDPLYTYYNVENYIASYNNGPGAVSITGYGQYKIGGEFAVVQEMTLDLDIEGQGPVHFDSGQVPAGAPFPVIDVSCAIHGFYCYDTVLVVNAKPFDDAGVPSPRAGLDEVRPNPFAHGTTISFTLDRPGRVDLTVVDLAGRRVRALASGQSLSAGQKSATWDGMRDDGRAAQAGVYWVLMRWPGGDDRRRIVKLD